MIVFFIVERQSFYHMGTYLNRFLNALGARRRRYIHTSNIAIPLTFDNRVSLHCDHYDCE